MKALDLILTALLLTIAAAGPAHAGPVAAAIGTIITAVKGSVLLSALFRVVASAVLSRLAASLAPKPKQPGIKTEGTSSGSQNPASFLLGYYATDGVMVCPPMSHGRAGKTPNAFLTYVIELGDVAGQSFAGLMINGERCPLGSTPHADYGLPVNGGTYDGKAWVKYYDGTQTVADPMLVAKYGGAAQRPWSSAMVGRGIAYAIVTFQYRRQVYSSFPAVRFEMQGIPLYDPRNDSTVGGSGAQRLADRATWAATNNPIVMVYNIHLGIVLPGGEVWGGGMPATDLPLASVFAAANACDALVDNGTGGTEARFRAGFEVFVSEEPASVCEELLTACLGGAADVGGSWRFQAGDPSLPVFSFSDDDLLVSLDREKQPFPGLDGTHNGITGSYPDPAVQWEPNDAPPIYNATWEAEDGGRRLVVNIDFPAVPYGAQVQRNMRALIKDNRRFLIHGLPFPPEATVLEPLDTVSWTSAANAYAGKSFEIAKTTESLRTGVVQVEMRERDPADTAVIGGYFTATGVPSALPIIPPAQAVASFGVAGATISDAGAVARRPALLLTWDGTDQEGIRGLEFEVRRTGTTALVAKGTTTDIVAGQMIVAQGILPATSYEARAILVSERATVWTSWQAASSPAVYVKPDELDGAAFEVAGLSVFNGALRSSDFAAGATGWEIKDDGSAEFNSLIVRAPMIEVGAVSSRISVAAPGPFSYATLDVGYVIATLDMGAIAVGDIWQAGVTFQARKVNTTSPSFEMQMQRRYRLPGGAFNAWAAVNTFVIPASLVAYDLFEFPFQVMGVLDDLEFRLVVTVNGLGAGGGGGGTYQMVRNVNFSAVLLTK